MLRCRHAAAPFAGPGVDRELDDLAQEAAIGALQARRYWTPEGGPFEPFEWSCMRCRVQDTIKATLRLKRGAGEETMELLDELDDAPDVTETVLEAHEAMANVHRLPAPQQRAIVCVAAGLTSLEVAEREGVTVDAIYRRLRQARHKLAA